VTEAVRAIATLCPRITQSVWRWTRVAGADGVTLAFVANAIREKIGGLSLAAETRIAAGANAIDEVFYEAIPVAEDRDGIALKHRRRVPRPTTAASTETAKPAPGAPSTEATRAANHSSGTGAPGRKPSAADRATEPSLSGTTRTSANDPALGALAGLAPADRPADARKPWIFLLRCKLDGAGTGRNACEQNELPASWKIPGRHQRVHDSM
jgi:hypothetical protein